LFFQLLDEIAPYILNELIDTVASCYTNLDSIPSKLDSDDYFQLLEENEKSIYARKIYSETLSEIELYDAKLLSWARKYNVEKQDWIIQAAKDMVHYWTSQPDYRHLYNKWVTVTGGFCQDTSGPMIQGWDPIWETESSFDTRIRKYKEQVMQNAISIGAEFGSRKNETFKIINKPEIEIAALILRKIVPGKRNGHLIWDEIFDKLIEINPYMISTKENADKTKVKKAIKRAEELLQWEE
jgi:tRNA splicing endonuclease